MSKDKKNVLAASDLGGKWRIRSRTGAAYVGEVGLIFDNALVVDMVNGERVIIFLDAIESMWEGLEAPRAQTETAEKTEEKKVE